MSFGTGNRDLLRQIGFNSLVERYVALAKSSGVTAVIVLTKLDLCPDSDARLDDLASRMPSSIERYAVDATSPMAAECLAPYLTVGNTGVLLGSSGAGKSTLTNTLMGTQAQRTRAVREDDRRGRHTTTSRHLWQLPCGGCLIDTPGLRGLRLGVDESALDAVFEDVQLLAAHCRFRDCEHQNEPGCAVRTALSADRLANYHKLKREVARDHADALARQATKSRVKAQHRALRAMQKDRR